MEINKIIVIPDIHGRTFWKDTVKDNEKELIIFLGDYLDPYGNEGIEFDDALKNFKEIIVFKKEHSDNVILLLGNHDLHYLDCVCEGGRKKTSKEKEIRQMFLDNRHLFKMCHTESFGDKKYLFSHAGIQQGWINSSFVEGDMITYLNDAWASDLKQQLYVLLSETSFYRGGNSHYGSCVWADVREHLDGKSLNDKLSLYEDYYQIFGHTQLIENPIIMENFACLDCRCGFIINNDGKIEKK